MEGWDKGKFAQEVGKERCFHGAILFPRTSFSFSLEIGDSAGAENVLSIATFGSVVQHRGKATFVNCLVRKWFWLLS